MLLRFSCSWLCDRVSFVKFSGVDCAWCLKQLSEQLSAVTLLVTYIRQGNKYKGETTQVIRSYRPTVLCHMKFLLALSPSFQCLALSQPRDLSWPCFHMASIGSLRLKEKKMFAFFFKWQLVVATTFFSQFTCPTFLVVVAPCSFALRQMPDQCYSNLPFLLSDKLSELFWCQEQNHGDWVHLVLTTSWWSFYSAVTDSLICNSPASQVITQWCPWSSLKIKNFT